MKILILCTDAYGGYGGIALYNRDLAEAVASDARVEEVVMLPRIVKAALEPMPANITFVTRAAGGLRPYLAACLKVWRQRKQFDLVICAHVNVLPIAKLFGRKTILLVYGIEAWKPLRPWTRRLLNSMDGIVSISELTLRRMKSWTGYSGETYILPNAIHLDRYGIRTPDPELAHRFGLEGKRVLLTLGRVVAAERYKGFDEVLEVMPELLKDVANLVYVIAGSGNDVPRLKAKAARLGITDSVVFTGMVDEAEKASLYSLADAYVMPSRGEGFGFVLLEALAVGVPVVASRHDGGFEAIREGMLGRAVSPSNLAELREAITDTLAIRERRIPAGLSYFAFDRFVSRVHSLLDHLTSPGT